MQGLSAESIVCGKQLTKKISIDNDNVVENAVNAVTAKLQHWTIDDDTYNLDAFDQCEGAWPIGHPLPLPMWSNRAKAPFIVEKVSFGKKKKKN